MSNKFRLSSRSKVNREGVDTRLIEISDLAITLTSVDFGHGNDSGIRTATRQGELYASGKSRADGAIRKSNHQTGKALDFYAYVDGKASWQPKYLAMVAAAFLQAASILGYQASWGGLYRSQNNSIYGWDMPHLELLD